jgi:uncharacterized membrane protein (UPF0136 family)
MKRGAEHCGVSPFFNPEDEMKKQTVLLWIGGVVGVLTMGALRFIGKNTDIFGLMAAMAVVIAILAFFVIRYVNRKW